MSAIPIPADVRAALERHRAETETSDQPPVSAPPETSTAAPASEADDTPADRKASKTVSTLLVELALSRYALGVTGDGEAFAVAKAGSHLTRMLRTGKTGLRAELASAYFDRYAKVATQQALADALMVLQGICRTAQPTAIHLRVAEHDGVSYVDLGDSDERAVRIGPEGWSVLDTGVPVLFLRTQLTGPLPVPQRGGSLAQLWEVINVAEPDRPLVLAWLVAALISPDIPHPILSLFAEQGSGKSSATRNLAALVDPSTVALRKPPKDINDWVTAAQASWVIPTDNLSRLPEWLSDSMCRAVTGDGDVRRALFTDGELAVFAFRRCLIVNGIDIGAPRGDFNERSLLAHLQPIAPSARRPETELAAHWEAHYPLILGALLDLASAVKAVLPTVRLDSSPRMADFARILAAVDRVCDTTGLAHYLDQSRSLAVDSLDSDPFVVAVQARISTPFVGTAAELLMVVTPTDERWRAPAGWPKNARAASGALKRNAPALRAAGWTVDNLGIGGRNNTVRWSLTPPPIREGPQTTPPFPPFPSAQVNSTESGGNRGGATSRHSAPFPPGSDGSGSRGNDGGNPTALFPPDFSLSTCDNGNGGNAGVKTGPSHIGDRAPSGDDLDGLCPECGYDGVPADATMHYDCASAAQCRTAGLTTAREMIA